MVQAQELVNMKEQEESRLYTGFWGQIKYFFQAPSSNDEFTLKDRQKVPIYLQVSLQNLVDMFNIIAEVSFIKYILSILFYLNNSEIRKYLLPYNPRTRRSLRYCFHQHTHTRGFQTFVISALDEAVRFLIAICQTKRPC